MERGTISSVHGGGGTISRPGNVGVRFYCDGVAAKDRSVLRKGDAVKFVVESSENDHMAVNVSRVA